MNLIECSKCAGPFEKGIRGSRGNRCPQCMRFKTNARARDRRKDAVTYKPDTVGTKRVLHVGDLHLPFTHSDYLSFCIQQYKRFKCDTVVFSGDVVDHHAISYHENEHGAMSASEELAEAQEAIKAWVAAFPEAKVSIGNHDCLPKRKAKTFGLPDAWLREYAEVYDTPGWDWQIEFVIDNVMYHHGKGSGKNAALNMCIKEGMSCAMGHVHSFGGVQYNSSSQFMHFGLNSGCGIDIKRYAFEYGKNFSQRPTLGCGVVLHGTEAFFVPMKL